MIIDSVRLPEDVERGVRGGPLFSTSVLRSDGGGTSTNQNWTYPLYQGRIGYGLQSKSSLIAVQNFFWARRGRLRGFLFRDWSDYELTNQQIGVGDGVTLNWPIVRTYSDTVLPFTRPITRPIEAGLNVYIDGVLLSLASWSLLAGGIVRIPVAVGVGDIITVSDGFFDIPVMFNTDQLDMEMQLWNAGSVPEIPISEVRE